MRRRLVPIEAWRPTRVGVLAVCAFLAFAACSRTSTPQPAEPEVGFISTPWRLERQEAKTLFVLVADGGCIDFDHIAVDEADDEVRLTALSRLSNSEGCSGGLGLELVAVCLRSPLGNRKLSRSAISDDWPGKKSIDAPLPPGLKEPDACR
jgi:hypothetical protein